MTKQMRDGLGLICLALIFLLASLAVTGQASIVIRLGAVLFGISGLLVAALGLFRNPASQ